MMLIMIIVVIVTERTGLLEIICFHMSYVQYDISNDSNQLECIQTILFSIIRAGTTNDNDRVNYYCFNYRVFDFCVVINLSLFRYLN